MILTEILEKLSDFDDNHTIYAERNPKWSGNSHAIICLQSEDAAATNASENLSYFLEVEIAKEAVEVWTQWSGRKPTIEEKCTAVIYYAENDAFIECN